LVAHQWAIQGSDRVVVHSRTVDDASIRQEGMFADRKWELMDARPVSLATVYPTYVLPSGEQRPALTGEDTRHVPFPAL
jgi:hypothetical protein